MRKSTSFGWMETKVERDGEIISELMYFEKEGRSHLHDLWEICYIISGTGIIVNGSERVTVQKGSVCKIPPNTGHWMIPDSHLEILIVYSQSE